MRAASQNPQSARLMGIEVMRLNMITFGVGTGLAALAGVLIAPAFSPILPLVQTTSSCLLL